MAVENGKPVENIKDRPNGHVGDVKLTRKPLERQNSWSFWLVNAVARYVYIFPILLRQ